VRVAWDAAAGFEEMAFDGETITHVDRKLPAVGRW
jgi:hypothetical protein